MSKVKEFEVLDSSKIEGVKIIKPSVFEDHRGTLYTSFYAEEFSELVPEGVSFKHDKFSRSNHNVLRGLHGDSKSWKLVTAVFGKITQVVVDYRKDSPTYLQWESWEISDKEPMAILLPPYVGNGFYVHSEYAVYHYKLAYSGEYFDAEEQFTIKWNDPEVNIKWPTDTPFLSKRDS